MRFSTGVVVLQVLGGGKRKQVDATHVQIIADYKRGRDLNSPLAQAVPESNNGGRVWVRWRRRRRRRRKDQWDGGTVTDCTTQNAQNKNCKLVVNVEVASVLNPPLPRTDKLQLIVSKFALGGPRTIFRKRKKGGSLLFTPCHSITLCTASRFRLRARCVCSVHCVQQKQHTVLPLDLFLTSRLCNLSLPATSLPLSIFSTLFVSCKKSLSKSLLNQSYY